MGGWGLLRIPCWVFFSEMMRPATRSRSGVAKDPGGKSGDGESRDEVAPDVQAQQEINVIAGEMRQQVSDGDRVEVHSDSSSVHSEDGGSDVVRLVDQGMSGSHLQQDNVGAVADHLFDGLPQSGPAAVGKVQGPVSAAERSQMGDGKVKQAPWVNLFKDNRNLGKGIKLDVVDSCEDLLQIEEDDVDDVEEAWGCCLVGQFAGRFPGMAAVRTIQEGWKVKCQHWTHRSGWIVFKFESNEDRMCVLNGGPYFIYGRNLMLKSMPKCFRFEAEDLAYVPVWVQLPALPLDCWNARALSKIASRVGKPITTDKLTHSKGRLSYARVLVEVDASKELVTSVEMRLPTGDIYEQSVRFEFTPKYCKKCKSFGHVAGDCNKTLEGRNHSVYVAKRLVRPAAVTVNKKMPAGSSAHVMVTQEVRGVGEPHGVVLTGVSKHVQQAPVPVLLPDKNLQAAENSALPGSAGMRPSETTLRPDAGLQLDNGLRPDGATGQQQKAHEQRNDEAGLRPDAGLQKEDVGGSSVQIRELNSVGGKKLEAVVVMQGLAAVGMETRPLCRAVDGGAPVEQSSSLDRPVISASVSKGKAKGKSLQTSK